MNFRTNVDGASGRAAFQTTHWTVVLEAARPAAQTAQEAFARIYVAYWHPLYSYVRRRGHSPQDAEDVAQNFFVHLVENQSLLGIQREGGKFRSFLLRSLDNFLANEWDRARAQKRGGGVPLLSLDTTEAEAKYTLEPATTETPSTLFEREWMITLLGNVLEDLRRECAAAQRGALFDDLRLSIQGDRHAPAYAEIAGRHGMSEGAIKAAVHRLRKRYGQLLREEISRTVSCAEEVEEELRHFLALSSP